MAIKLKSYRSRLMEKLVIPSEAKHYINAALKDSKEFPEMFLEAIKDVAQARQMASVAKKSGMAREALYRSLSKSGNPTYETLISVLKAVGLFIDRVECLPMETGNTVQKAKSKKKSPIVLSTVDSNRATQMQAGMGWGSHGNTFSYGAAAAAPGINPYANAENIGPPARVSVEQQAVTINHLIHRGMTHGVGQDYTGNQGNSLQEK